MVRIRFDHTLKAVPAELKALRVWLKWRTEDRNGDIIKRPYYANGRPRSGDLDSAEDRAQLVPFEQARESLTDRDAGLAIALGRLDDGRIISGIDNDHCIADGKPTDKVQQIIDAAQTYTEISPSGEGVHILGFGDIGTKGSNGDGLEIYSGGRYFTMTGHALNRADLADLTKVADLARAAFGVDPKKPRKAKKVRSKVDHGDLRDALSWMSNDVDRDIWVRVCMATKFEMGESGRAVFIEWSKKHESYDAKETVRVWETANPKGDVTGSTIFRLALDRGWKKGRSGDETLVTERLSDIEVEVVKPLWPNRFYLGKASIIAGNMGLGKSTLSLDIAARITVGAEWPDASGKAPIGDVLILSTEDGAADTIRPRIESMGGDVRRVHIIQGVESKSRETGKATRRLFSLTAHMDLLRRTLAERQGEILLVIIDPITGVFHGTDTHKTADTREVFAALKEVLEESHVALIGISHPNKAQGQAAVYRITGSLAFAAAPRSAFIVGTDPEHEDRGVFAELKNNLGPRQPSLGFQLIGRSHPVAGSVPTVEWLGVVEGRPDDILDPRGHSRERATEDRRDVAVNWLRNLLAGGPVESKQIETLAKQDGFSERVVRAAKGVLGTRSRKGAFGKGKWVVYLPNRP